MHNSHCIICIIPVTDTQCTISSIYYTCTLCLVQHVSINNKCELFAFCILIFEQQSRAEWVNENYRLFICVLSNSDSFGFILFAFNNCRLYFCFDSRTILCSVLYSLQFNRLGCRYCFSLYSSATLLTAYRVCVCIVIGCNSFISFTVRL